MFFSGIKGQGLDVRLHGLPLESFVSDGHDVVLLGFEHNVPEPLGPTRHVDAIFVLCIVSYVAMSLLWTSYLIFTRRSGMGSRTGRVYTLLVCLSWGLFSVCMQVLNKAVVERTMAPSLISSVQMLIAVAIMLPFSMHELFSLETKQLCRWLVVPLVYGAAVCTSSYTYEYISLSLYTIVRNLAPLMVVPVEAVLMEKAKLPQITVVAVAALVVMVIGAVLYVGGIHGFSWLGILFAVVNMFLAISDRLLQRRLLTKECKDLPTTVCTLINNAVGMIPCLCVAHFTHELRDARLIHTAKWAHPHNVLLIMLSGVGGLGICFLGFECQRVISVTSFYVMQNVSRVFLVALGVLLFKDPLHSPCPITGLCLSLVGSCVYGNIQIQSQEAEIKRATLEKGNQEKESGAPVQLQAEEVVQSSRFSPEKSISKDSFPPFPIQKVQSAPSLQ